MSVKKKLVPIHSVEVEIFCWIKASLPILCYTLTLFPLWASMFRLPPRMARLLLQGIPPAERNNAQDYSLSCRALCVCLCMHAYVRVRVCYSAGSLMAEEEDGQVAQVCVYVCRRRDTLWTSSVKTFSDDWSLERITNSSPLVWQMSPLDKYFRNSLITLADCVIM